MKQPDLKKYAKEMDQMQYLPPASLEISPLAALAIITHIQLASRHPEARGDLTKIAIDCAKELQNLFNPKSVTYQVLELGWNPEEDIPLPQEPKVEPFEGFCEQPCENFVKNLGCRCTGYRVAEVADGESELPPEVLASGAAIFEKVKKLFEAEGFEVIN